MEEKRESRRRRGFGRRKGREKTAKGLEVLGTISREANCSEARYPVRGPSKSRPGEGSRPRVVESSVPSMTVHSLHRLSVGGSFG
jgi:hypothetical protein